MSNLRQFLHTWCGAAIFLSAFPDIPGKKMVFTSQISVITKLTHPDRFQLLIVSVY